MSRYQVLLIVIATVSILGTIYIVPSPLSHQDNITILSNLASGYYQNHEYTLEQGYVCLDMAMDFWDIATAHKINARIIVGNRTKMPDSIVNADHAWVLVEVEPDNWIPVEVVNGTVMAGGNTYYHGWVFNSPQEIKDFLDEYDILIIHHDIFAHAHSDYDEKVQVYNDLIENGGDQTEIERMSNELKDLKKIVDYTEHMFNQSQVKVSDDEAKIPKILGEATI